MSSIYNISIVLPFPYVIALSLTISAYINPQPISLMIFLNALLQIPAMGAKTILFFKVIFFILNIYSLYQLIITYFIVFNKEKKLKINFYPIFSTPPIYGLNAAGIFIVPSSL